MIDEIKPIKKIKNFCDLKVFLDKAPDVIKPDCSNALMKPIEVIDVIEAWELNYHLGMALKHICRSSFKTVDRSTYEVSEKEELEKALYYLDGFLRNCLCAKAGGYFKKEAICVEKVGQSWGLNTSLELAIMHLYGATLSKSTFHIEEAKKAIDVRLKQLKVFSAKKPVNGNSRRLIGRTSI